ncbi:carbohydrate ABC transporter substrate-binding protein (CUT1 family) [Nonomuraea polychroma]|uniref:Carbohydrate ABC transporter substrate-binding protein (CUT1 family) n=1 Tax=Nonomuraea polychroma TaxID=46176 RepID=A0A438M8L8_9ACTN|nr:extracellular solute-binding protein [Nonomuraea polychroma]RVX42061.1 carbohydrate ABC transporter substrate-binding protein (CUT1 family) [Nonomuraea polychroma]
MRFPRRPAVIAATAVLALTSCGTGTGSDPGSITLTIAANSIQGGKNSESATWIKNWVIPEFEKTHKNVKVLFQPSGVDDEQYKTKLALDLKSKAGADVIDVDGIWVGEFAQAGYIKPLAEVGGPTVEQWEGWSQIPQAVQGLGIFDGKKYGLPQGTDGRVLFYNKTLFNKAGLPETWEPTSWQDILDAGNKLKAAGVPVPIQINAGTAMGEATTMQGVLPLLAGAGAEIYADGKWTGASQAVKDVLGFYQQIYGASGLGDPKLQQEAKGRDKSFAQFAQGKIGILAESDYFWRSVVEPTAGVAPMKDRDQVVGYAKIPAKQPGAGIRGQDHVSMSGGAVRVLNPFSKNPRLAWELLAFMHSAEATKTQLAGQVRISSRTDVNTEVLTADPMLKYIADEVLPVTAYRPGLAVYPQVSTALQEATAAVVSGKSADEAAAAYQDKLQGLVGGAANVSG